MDRNRTGGTTLVRDTGTEWKRNGREGRCGQNTESLKFMLQNAPDWARHFKLVLPLLCAWTSFRLDIYPEGRNLLPRDANMQRIIHITRKVSARYAPEVPYIRRLPELCYLPDAGRQSTSPTHSLPYIHTGLHPRNNLTLKDGLTKSEIWVVEKEWKTSYGVRESMPSCFFFALCIFHVSTLTHSRCFIFIHGATTESKIWQSGLIPYFPQFLYLPEYFLPESNRSVPEASMMQPEPNRTHTRYVTNAFIHIFFSQNV
jgi:hypothetical protein